MKISNIFIYRQVVKKITTDNNEYFVIKNKNNEYIISTKYPATKNSIVDIEGVTKFKKLREIKEVLHDRLETKNN